MAHVLCIVASPRKEGNCAKVTELLLQDLHEEGHTSEVLNLYDYAIKPCVACGFCEDNPCHCSLDSKESFERIEGEGQCADDAAFALLEKIRLADAVLLASPVYFYGPPALMKALIDRSQRYWALQKGIEDSSPIEKPAFIALVAAREKGEKLFEASLLIYRTFLSIMGFSVQDPLCLRGLEAMGDIEKDSLSAQEAQTSLSSMSEIWRQTVNLLCHERRCLACSCVYIPEYIEKKKAVSPFEVCLQSHLCSNCAKDLLAVSPPACTLCGQSVLFPTEKAALCEDCHEESPPWSSIVFVGSYGGFLRDLILRGKFGDNIALLSFLGKLLGKFLALSFLDDFSKKDNPLKDRPYDILVPIPLHIDRLRERGFNQCIEIGRACAKTVHIPLCLDALERIVATKQQVDLSELERQANVEGAFLAKKEFVSGKGVLLLDDIMTTGSTLRSATKALLEAGATSVHVVIIGRAQKD